jgi:hypothetical protein
MLAGLGVGAAAAYAGYVAVTWSRYGRPSRDGSAPRLDRFMPRYDVRERHHTVVNAPAAIAFRAARSIVVGRSPVVRALFGLRALPSRLLGAPAPPRDTRAFVDQALAAGWRILDEETDRCIVVGAVTQPWKAEVEFRGLAPEEFVGFDEPDYTKILWTIEVEPIGFFKDTATTETRVATTDERSRRRFRWYWSLLSPGIILIRYELLRLITRELARQHTQS